MKKFYLFLMGVVSVGAIQAQTFTNSTNLLPTGYNSGGCTGVVDMNNDGLDDIVILDQSTNLKIAYQQANGSFTVSSFGTVSGTEQWGMCIGDVDNDGHKDVLCGGYYDDVHIVDINGPGDFSQDDYAWASIFMQGTNLADIDNDGWLDGFSCHDDGHSAILHNDGTGSMTDGAAMMDLTFYPETNGNDNSGNYGSVWTDFDRDGDIDLFIAKCRQFIDDPYDPRRTNILMVNDGNNNYTEQAQERGLVNLQQSWTSDFADMDNDGDFDVLLTTHSNTLEIYANDGAGYFTNVTAGSGLELSGFYLQAKMVDFDNDGFVDLVHAGGSHRFFHNNGDMTFTQVNNLFQNDDTMHSFGIGDLNNDGWLDLYASYGDGYVDPDMANDDQIFINDGGSNNFIYFDLEGTISNKDAAGALVEIHGAWGVQIREVRDGESYGITNQSKCHFGLGSATSVDYAVIHWPAGGMKVIDNPAINTTHEIIEGECTPPSASIAANGPTDFCAGGSVNISIVNGATNQVWSNGESTSSINVMTPGIYGLLVWDNEGCAAYSNQITVNIVTDPTPGITVDGELEFCEGGSVQLLASSGNSYQWSNGETSQAISVTASGDYHVLVTGPCQTLDTELISVSVTDAPDAPSITDVYVNAGETATLTVAGGTNVNWYDSQNATTPIFEGNSYTTPAITATTTYWVEDAFGYGGLNFDGGKSGQTQNNQGQYQQSNQYYLKFDVAEDATIHSVHVYANGASNRTIQVIDADGAEVAVGTFAIADGESDVVLDFFVPAGTGYGIRITSNNPQLWRDKDLNSDAPFGFPYNIGNVVTITGTNVGGADTDNYYYYFYDWNVVTPYTECASSRVEVTVNVVGIEELTNVRELNVYPNPASTELNISLNLISNEKINLNLTDMSGRVVRTVQMNASAGSNQHSFNLSDVAAGIYNLNIQSGGRTATKKVVVQ